MTTPEAGVHAADALHVGERRTRVVVLLSAVTMVVELVAGWSTGSMALVADGWHMGTHVGALGFAWAAYRYGRRAQRLGRLAFGPAKINALAGYTSALVLGAAAIAIAGESLHRLTDAQPIRYGEAALVAVLGLVVNIVAALLLGADHDHGDHNLRGVYLHVLADALTSLLAIAALGVGAWTGVRGVDPVAGIVGAALILWWAAGLARRTAIELADMSDGAVHVRATLVAHLEKDGDVHVEDVRVWPLGGGVHGCTVRISTERGRSPSAIREQIEAVHPFGHLAVEICEARE